MIFFVLFQGCVHIIYISLRIAMMFLPMVITSHFVVLLIVFSVGVILLVLIVVVSASSSVYFFLFGVHIDLDFFMRNTSLIAILFIIVVSDEIWLIL